MRPAACSIWRDDRGGLVVGQLERGRQLDRDASLRAVDERLRTRRACRRSRRAALLRDEAQEVVDERVGPVGELAEDADLRSRLELRVARNAAARATAASASANSREVAVHRLEAALLLRRLEEGRRRGAARLPSSLASPSLERGEVEPVDRLVDQAPLVVRVEHLADDALRRLEREVGDLAADLLDRARGLGVDLLAGLLEPPLTLDLGLVLRPLDLRVGDLAGLGEDRRGLAPGLGRGCARCCSSSVARLVPGVVGLLDGLADRDRAARRSSSGSGRTRTS